MGRTIYKLLRRMKDESYTVPMMAKWAGCSSSQFYRYVPSDVDSAEAPRGDELFALAYNIAEEHEDLRLLNLLLPRGARIVFGDDRRFEANGWQDEVNDAALATASAIASGQGKSADGLRRVAAQYREISERLDVEADAIEQQINQRSIRKIG